MICLTPRSRKKVEQEIDEKEPLVVTGSPPCTKFTVLMNLVMSKNISAEQRAKFHAELDKAIGHIRFCVKIYYKQIMAGRYFLHEHPAGASSWELHEIIDLMSRVDVMEVIAHQCASGLTTTDVEDKSKQVPVKKPTRFITNSWCIGESLDRKCQCQVPHGSLLGGRAAAAAIYPDKLCDAICKGIANQIKQDMAHTVATRPMHAEGMVSFVNEINPGSLSRVMDHYTGHPDHWRDTFHELDGTSVVDGKDVNGRRSCRWS